MNYNIDFLVAALILLLVIWYHFIDIRKMHTHNSQIVWRFIILGILNVTFDLITTVLISDGRPDFREMTQFFLTVFYLLQVLVPYALFAYTWSLCEQTTRKEKVLEKVLAVPAVLMGCVVLYNIRTGVLFWVNEAGEYIRGSMYLGMYRYALAYGFIILVCSIWRYRKLGGRKFKTILEFLVILACCVGVQAMKNQILTTGFGLMLGILVLYLTINNPSDYTDTPTGMFNGRSFRRQVGHLYEKGKVFHIILVDLPRLRQINMLFGSKCGDTIVSEVAQELRKFRGGTFRLSGKRFAVVVTSRYEYENIRSRVVDFLNEPKRLGQEKIQISGIACGVLNCQEMKDYDALISYMDYLITLSPSSVETTFVQGDENIREEFLKRKEIESYLRTAIKEDLFELYYQPIFSVEKNRFVTLEALSRLRHPELGPVSPDIFIGIAEQSGQIVQIGQLQFRRLCRFVKEHPELMDKLENVKFNLSPAEILREGCSRKILEAIEEFGLPYSFFQFEITETVATEYGERIYQIAEDFRRCGIALSLDDFGSGYANLDAVLKLSFCSIKLDRSLLSDIMKNKRSRTFYQSIVAVLKDMGYCVISEGVEYKEEVEFLRSCGIDMIQGYFFSKPLPSENLIGFLSLN